MSNSGPVKGVIIAAVSHDLSKKRSLVSLTWQNDPEKRLTLDVPFGCSLSDLPREAERALRAFSAELAVVPVISID